MRPDGWGLHETQGARTVQVMENAGRREAFTRADPGYLEGHTSLRSSSVK